MKSLLLYLCLMPALPFFGQHLKGRVTDAHSGAPLAFVAVVEQGTNNGAYTDIDGYFRLAVPSSGSVISFSYIGYQSLLISWNGQDPWMVQMEVRHITTPEVVILPGENPAERIMKKAIDARDRNNPERRTSFSYDSYNKLVFTADIDSADLVNPDRLISVDTSMRSVLRYFSDKHLFIMESATHRKFLPPDRTEETILANKVSGLRDPSFALLGTQIQSFSFYGETVSILDVSYLSPLASGAIKKYLFILEDTTFVGSDTVFTISFRPRKGRNFSGMKGQLFIHSSGYAIQNVIAEPVDSDASLQIRVQQQYQFTPGGWFPDQLNSFLRFPGLKTGSFEVVGIGRSYIRNLTYGDSFRQREFGPVVLMMDEKAKAQPDSVWDALRQHPLDARELKTYQKIDSVGEEINLDRKVEMLTMLATGKLPLGPISLDLDRLMRFNNYEGWRLGCGLHTNDFFSRIYSIGGYYAYGFRDRQHKAGGDMVIRLNRKREVQVRVSMESDVVETGGRAMDIAQGAGLFAGQYYPYFINRMDRYEKKEVAISGRWIGNLSGKLYANTQDIRPYVGEVSRISPNGEVSIEIMDIPLFETGVQLRWAPGEKLMRTGRGEVRLGGKYPTFHFRFSQAFSGILNGAYSYSRYDAAIEKPFRITHAGLLSVRLAGGWVPDQVPVSLQYNAQGTNNLDYSGRSILGIAVPYSFETMRTNEFMHSRYFAFHLRHNFKDLLIRIGDFRPHISLVHQMLWGDRQGDMRSSSMASEARKAFLESGVVVDRLMVSGFSGLGLGCFYRYGPHGKQSVKENLAVKLSVSIAF